MFRLAIGDGVRLIVQRRGFTRAMKHFINGIFHYGFWKVLLSFVADRNFFNFMIWSIDGPQWQVYSLGCKDSRWEVALSG